VDLTGISFSCGLSIVPLFVLIQRPTPKHEMAREFVGLNMPNPACVVAAAVTRLALQQAFGWSILRVFLALAIANVLASAWIFTIVPEFAMRFVSWLLVRTLYRLELHGIERHVPDEGPAVLVCNHVSYMDALILAASVPRPIRFVMYYRIFQIPVMRWIFRAAGAIPIASPKEDAAMMERAFDRIDAALAEGELVLIFPEGRLTTDGEMGAFRSGVERILRRRPVPVVPMALRGMWASMWSRRDSRLGRMRVPRRFRAHVQVMAEAPIAGEATDATLLEA